MRTVACFVPAIAVFFASIQLSASPAKAACSNPIVRMEWNQLTPDQKTAYAAAVRKLADNGLQDSIKPGIMGYYDLVKNHVNGAYYAHAVAQFYPFHRAMLYLYEQMLIYAGWDLGLVYWDWSAVAQNWWESDIFQYFGENVGRSSDSCLTQGPFAAGKYNVSPYPPFGASTRNFPAGDKTCLRRCGFVGTPLDDPGAIADAHLKATTYNDFRSDDTSGYHANGHITVGGDSDHCDMGNFYVSPNDPGFYLHHGFIDKTWWKWQHLCPSYLTDFEGHMVPSPADKSGVASLQEVLDQWTNFKVSDMMDTLGGSPLCYTYTQSSGDVTFDAPACPDGSAPNLNWPFASVPNSSPSSRTGTTPTTASSVPTPTVTRDLEKEKEWLTQMVQGLLVVTSGGGLTRAPGSAVVRRSAASLPLNATIVDSKATNTTTNTTTGNLGDAWMSVVAVLNADVAEIPTVVSYADGAANVTVPDACSVHLIVADRVVLACNRTALETGGGSYGNGTQVPPSAAGPNGASFADDDAGAETFYTVAYPGIADPRVPTMTPDAFSGVCVKAAEDCIVPSPPLTPEQVARRHLVYDRYVIGYNKMLAYVERCNRDESCVSVAAQNKKLFSKSGNWDHLSG